MRIRLQVFLLFFLTAGSCNSNSKSSLEENGIQAIRVFAASGARPVCEEICENFEELYGVSVFRNYASSGILARQIASGATCDLYISASEDWISFLLGKNIIARDSIKLLASNSLVVVSTLESIIDPPLFQPDFDIEASLSKNIAIGDPSYVPVGKYAWMVFESLGWDDRLRDRCILTKDVSSVLNYAEMGECEWGVVYLSEARQSQKVRVLAMIPDSLHTAIEFHMAIFPGSGKKAVDLANLFLGSNGQGILEKHGFRIEKHK